MRKIVYRKYLLLLLFLTLLIALPVALTEGLRMRFIALFSPLWTQIAPLRIAPAKVQALQNAHHRLEAENHLLCVEMAKLKSLVEQKYTQAEESGFLQNYLSRAVAATVIYRDPAQGASFFWIGVGEKTNEILGEKIICKNSPVVVGKNVVGAIDHVGKKQSLVRLITDRKMAPSVRVSRGSAQNKLCLERIEAFQRTLLTRTDLPITSDEKNNLEALLKKLKDRFNEKQEDVLLAKGIVQGKGAFLWRKADEALRGSGFNYDFPDASGFARDLSTGKPVDSTAPATPLIKIGDVLITTGMDGVFPVGLRVAEVTKVYPLREGGYAYEIDARPLVHDLDSLHTVFVLPPLDFDHEGRKK